MSETGDTPSPLAITQLLPEPKVDPNGGISVQYTQDYYAGP